MKKMSPKDLFSKKNLMTTLLTCVATAGIIAGTFIFISHAAPASTINNVVYMASDGLSGNKTVLTVNTNGDFTTTGNTTCPPVQGVPGDGTCYPTNSVILTNVTGNITAVLRGNPTSVIKVYMDSQNAVANLTTAAISFSGIGDAIGTLSKTGFNNPPPPTPTAINGSVIYTAVDGAFGNVSTLTAQANGNFTDEGIGACPGGNVTGNTCYGTGWITASSGITGTLTAIKRMDLNTIKLVYATSNVITSAPPTASITLGANTGGVKNAIVANNFATPVQNITTINSATYNPTDSQFGNLGSLKLQLNGNLTDQNKLGSCPDMQGVTGAICYNTNVIINKSANITGTIAAVMKGNPSNSLTIVFSAQGGIDNPLENTSLTLNNTFGNIPSTVTKNGCQLAVVAPSSIVGSGVYTAIDPLNNNFSTAVITLDNPPTEVNKISCGAIGDANTVCFPVNNASFSGTGVAANTSITASIKLKTIPGKGANDSNKIIIFFNQANALDMGLGGSLTLDMGSFGGSANQMKMVNSWSVLSPTAVTGTMEYKSQNADINNYKSTILVPFDQQLNSTGTASCPAGLSIPAGAVCYNKTGITIGGSGLANGITTTNIAAVVKASGYTQYSGQDSKFVILFNVPNVLTAMNFTITFNGQSGMSNVTGNQITDSTQNWNISAGQVIYIKSQQPPAYSSITNATNQIAIKFSGPLDMTTATDANVSIYIPGQTPTAKTKTLTFDLTTSTLYITLTQALSEGENTLAVDLGNLKAANGTSIPSSHFQWTVTSSSASKPQVLSTSIANNATGVSVLTNDITFRFDQALASPLNTTTGITITPALGISTPYFDPETLTLHLIPKAALQSNTTYTVNLVTKDGQNNAVTDANSNTLKGLANNVMDNYTLSFTTGGVSNTAPRLTWGEFKTGTIRIGYNIPLQASALTTTNWAISCGGSPVSLSGATITNNSSYGLLEFKGVVITAGQNCTATLSNVTGANGIAFGGTDNVISGTSTSEITYAQGQGTSWSYGMCVNATCTEANRWADPATQWAQIKFEPNIKVQETEASETQLQFPITKSLSNNDKIVIVLPTGSSVNTNTLGTIGTDINGSSGINLSGTYYPNGKMTVLSSAYNATQNSVTLTIGLDATGDGIADAGATTNSADLIGKDSGLILKGFINGSVTTYSQSGSTGGSYVTFSTTSGTTGQPIESVGQSAPYTVVASGSASISGFVTKSVGNTGISGIKVKAEGTSGTVSATTAGNGSYTISNLPNGAYMVFIDPTTTGNYIISSSQNSVTTSGATNGINFKLEEGTKTINVTIQNGSIGSDGNTKIMLEGSNRYTNQRISKQITLSAGGTTTSSLLVTPGEWEISVNFYKAVEFTTTVANNASEFGFMKPQGIIVNVTDASQAQSITIPLGANATDATINVTVQDSSGNAITSANVYAYRPDGTIGGTQATTDANGVCSLKIKNGTYTVGAMLSGTPGFQEQSVTVAANGSTSVTFKLNVPSIIISGTVTSDVSSKEAWIQATGPGGFFATTQSNKETGLYSLKVNANTTYTITASSVNGPITPNGSYVSGSTNSVPVVGSNITGVNFQSIGGTFAGITGTVSPVEKGVRVCAESYNPTTKNTTGLGNCAVTNDSGYFIITTTKNSVNDRYRLSAYSTTYGSTTVENINISLTDAVQNITFGTSYATTVTITGVPTTVTSAFFEMKNTTTGDGTSFELKSFTNGTATKTFSLPQGTYTAVMQIPGLGELYPDTGKTVNLTSAKSLNFTVSNLSADIKTFNITVANGANTPIPNAWVEAIDPSNGSYKSGITDANGQVSLSVKVGNSITISANHTLYPRTTAVFKKSDLSSSNTVAIEMGSVKSSTVTFNVTGSTTPIWVDIAGNDGNFWNGTSLDASGAGSISVPASLNNATAYLHAQTGESKTITGITAGQTVTATFASFTGRPAWMTTLMNDVPNLATFNPSIGLGLDDSANTGVKLSIGTNSIGTDSNQYSAKIQTVANIPNNAALTTRGIIGKEITFTDANGNLITDLTGEYEISIVLFKTDIDAAMGNAIDSYDDIETMQLGYWDNSTSSYVPESTTKTIYVEENSESDWTMIDIATLIANLKTNADYYFNYKIELTSLVDHATIFSPIVSSDMTAPDAPDSLTATASSATSALLNWDDNAESDFLEYEIYRSTTSPVTISDGNQVNASAVTSSTFTNTGLTAGRYYYIVTAVDDSGNESLASSERSVTITGETGGTPTTDTEESTEEAGGSYIYGGLPGTLDDDNEDITLEGEEDNSLIIESGETDYENHWAKSYIEKVIAAGIAQGISEKSFEPDRSLTRAEMTKMVLNGFGYSPNTSITESTFSDVEFDAWYGPYVESAHEIGMVNGYSDGTFKPDNLVNRAEAMKIIVNTYAIANDITLTAHSVPFTDTISDAWYSPYISYGYYKGVVGGYSDGTFKPENPVTRAEFCKMIVTLLGL